MEDTESSEDGVASHPREPTRRSSWDTDLASDLWLAESTYPTVSLAIQEPWVTAIPLYPVVGIWSKHSLSPRLPYQVDEVVSRSPTATSAKKTNTLSTIYDESSAGSCHAMRKPRFSQQMSHNLLSPRALSTKLRMSRVPCHGFGINFGFKPPWTAAQTLAKDYAKALWAVWDVGLYL